MTNKNQKVGDMLGLNPVIQPENSGVDAFGSQGGSLLWIPGAPRIEV